MSERFFNTNKEVVSPKNSSLIMILPTVHKGRYWGLGKPNPAQVKITYPCVNKVS